MKSTEHYKVACKKIKSRKNEKLVSYIKDTEFPDGEYCFL